MKRTLLVVLCALLLAALAAMFLWDSTPAPLVDTLASDGGATAAHAAVLDAASLAGDDADEMDASAASAADARTSAPAVPAFDESRAIAISGRVLGPTAPCEDPTLTVYACTEAVDRETLARWLERDDGDADLRAKRYLGRQVVAPDGSFTLLVPHGTPRAHVSLAGRYSWRRESIEVDLTSGGRTLDLEAEAGACIRGALTLPAQTDVTLADLEGLEVRLRVGVEALGAAAQGPQVSRYARVADGRFEFRALPAAGTYRVMIEPEQLAAAEGQVSGLVACQTLDLAIPLARGGSIRGVVKSESGEPIADAKVEAGIAGMWFGFDTREVREGQSSADGSFVLDAVTPGSLVMRAQREGYLDNDPLKVEVVDGGVSSGVEIVLSGGNTVSGSVTYADGSLAADVPVELTFDFGSMYGMAAFNARRGASGKAKSDAEGRFKITGLGGGPFTVQAEALPKGVEIEDVKLRAKALHRARADTVQPNTTNVALVLRAPEGLAGRVVDETGAPVAAFRLHAMRPPEGLLGNFGREKHDEAFDDAEGRFLLTGLETGDWQLFAIAEGFAYPEPLAVSVPRASTEPEIVVTIAHAATIAGRVVDASGNAVAGADVALDTGEPNWMARVDQGPKKPGAKSLADGTFLLGALRAGKTSIVADSDDQAKSLPLAFDLGPAQNVTDVVLALREGGSLSGMVFDDSGEPASGMFVQVTDPKNFDQRMAFTDGRGEFEVKHLEPGTWQIVALPSQGMGDNVSGASDGDAAMSMFTKMKMTMVDIVDGEHAHVVLGAPPEDPVRVHGRVLHHGDPFAGALITFYPEGRTSLGNMKSTQVDKDGGYSVVLEKPGAYVAAVQKMNAGMNQQNLVEFTADIPKEKEHELDFAMPTGRISGRVRGPEGDDAASVRVSLHPESAVQSGTMWGGQYNELATDANGRFDIQALRPGRYTLLVGGMTMGGMFGDDAALGREIKSGLALSEGEWIRDLEFRLKRPGSIDVTVVDESGAPVAEATVFARNERGDLVDRFSMIATDQQGVASYGGLAAGRYTLSARKEHLASPESTPIRVEEGASTAAKIVMTGGTMLVVSFQGADEAPVKASVSVKDGEGRELSTMIGLGELMKMLSQGDISYEERRFGPLPAGTYRIEGRLDDGTVVKKQVTLNGQAERKLVLRFGS